MSGLLPSSETVSQDLHDTEEEADRLAVDALSALSRHVGHLAIITGRLGQLFGT